MTDERMAAAQAELPAWSAGSERAFVDLAETLGASVPDVRRDPTVLLPYLEEFPLHLAVR
jgi:hypothetical protein